MTDCGARDLRLVVAPERVSLVTGAGDTLASGAPEPVERRLEDLLWRLDLARRGGSSAEVAYRLRLVGEALGEAFCAGPVGEALAERIAQAAGLPVRLGIVAEHPRVADLPWEACVVAGQTRPLALVPGLEVFRMVSTAGNRTASELRAPLRVLVVLAAPDDGPPLDLEAEVGRIHEALGSSLQLADGRVRLLNQGTRTALTEALAEERFHAVHIACHARPGELILEDEYGNAQPVTAAELASALTGTQLPPLVVLSGCSTALGVPADGEEQTAAALPGLSRQLVAAGIPAVLAMTAPVTDDFPSRLAERFYQGLATSPEPEIVTVLSEARRDLEAARLEWATGARDTELVEWATPALFLGGPSRPLFRIGDGTDPDVRDTPPVSASLVGRRFELRALSRFLASDENSHIVLHGIEGIGKSRMAEELVRLLSEPDTPAVVVRGATTAAEIAAALPGGGRPAIVFCDAFEHNLVRLASGRHTIRDGQLAGFLSELLSPEGTVKVVFTSRHPFHLGHGHDTAVLLYQPWLLDDAFTKMMMFRLPAVDALPEQARAEVLTMIGGHPRALEHLQSLLEADGDAARSMAACIDLLTQECDLERVLAELDETALTVLQDASVHRRAAKESAVLARPAHVPENAYPEALRVLIAEGLIVRQGSTEHGEPTLLVPRWIATVLEHRADAASLAESHGKAAYTIRMELASEDDADVRVDLLLAAYYHHQRAGEQHHANEAIDRLTEIWFPRGQWRRLERMHHENLRWLPPDGAEVGAAHQELARLHVSRGDLEGALHHATIALGVFERVGNRPRMADMRHALGVIDAQRGRFPAAAAHCEAALELVSDLDAPDVVASCHMLLGGIAALVGDDQAAREHYDRAIAFWTEPGSDEPRAETAMIYKNLATLHHRRGEYEEGAEALRKAEAIYRELGDVDGHAMVWHELGFVAQATRDNAGATAWFREAARLRESLDNRSGAALHYHELGILATDRGDLEGASAYHRKALLACKEAGDQSGVASSLHELSLVAWKRGDTAEARALAQQALSLKEETGERPGVAATLNLLGRLLEQEGEIDEALAHFGRAAELSTELGLLGDISTAHRSLARIALGQGRHDDAASAATVALAADRRRSRSDAVVASLLLLARVRFSQSDLPASSVLYEEALELAATENNRTDIAEAHNQLGVIALMTGELTKARVHLDATLSLARSMDDRYNIAGGLRNLANVDRLEGDLDQAFARYQEAQEIFTSVDAVQEATAGHHELATIHRQRGETDQALARLKRYADAATASSDTRAYTEALHDMAEIRIELGLGKEAVLSALQAFVTSVAFGTAFQRKSLELLLRLRDSLGAAAFRRILETESRPEAAASITELLDALGSASDTTADIDR
ncbi:tetratricopeptide repeat protein [Streptomyces sp. NPDC002088]|uniref:tetratricopeptide repeat protein n=1 Tax=Streptomyces sp. NPDC002088 TaxID=3154665 RepID=UPI00332ABC09